MYSRVIFAIVGVKGDETVYGFAPNPSDAHVWAYKSYLISQLSDDDMPF